METGTLATEVSVSTKEQIAITQRIGTGVVLGLGTALIAGYLMAGFAMFAQETPATSTTTPSGYARENLEQPPRFVRSWGSQGGGQGQFSGVFHLDTDANGNVFTVEMWNHRVQKFARNGDVLATWGSQGSGNEQFYMPRGIGVDTKNEWVYVADTGNNRIVKYTLDGQWKTTWGTSGSSNGQFNLPYGVGVDPEGNVYVADSGNNRIQKFTADGVYVTQWNDNGLGGTMSFPLDVEGIAGGIYVIDAMNRVERFTPDGTFVLGWGGYGSGEGQLSNPTGISISPRGDIFVADEGNKRIQKFRPDGTFVSQWNGGDQLFGDTKDVAVDAGMFVSVTDLNRIQQFSYAAITPSE